MQSGTGHSGYPCTANLLKVLLKEPYHFKGNAPNSNKQWPPLNLHKCQYPQRRTNKSGYDLFRHSSTLCHLLSISEVSDRCFEPLQPGSWLGSARKRPWNCTSSTKSCCKQVCNGDAQNMEQRLRNVSLLVIWLVCIFVEFLGYIDCWLLSYSSLHDLKALTNFLSFAASCSKTSKLLKAWNYW